MRVHPEVEIGHHAGNILAVEIVMGRVDVPNTPEEEDANDDFIQTVFK